METKVSIIVPVYNGEKYLVECIESLLNQTLKECEFVFIDDGSTDNSYSIIEKYKHNDNRIKIIKQENQGASIARNKGLSKAKGKYIGFVDADDYIEPSMFEVMYNSMESNELDLVICDYELEQEGHKIISSLSLPKDILLDSNFIKSNVLMKFVESDELNSVWNKLYKRSLIQKNKVMFPQNVVLGEDEIFNIRYFSKINKLRYISYVGYHYREVQGSATRDIVNMDYFKKSLDIFNLNISEIEGISIDENKLKHLKTTKFINSVISNIYIYLKPNKDIKFKERFLYVRNMISHKQVVESIKLYKKINYDKKSRYEKLIIKMIERKFIVGIYIATMYSWYRNNKRREI